MTRGTARGTGAAAAAEAQIDLAALRANAGLAQGLAGSRGLIGVVKADAYGHGAVPVARALLQAGCTRLAVLSVGEAEELREAALAAPILVLGGVRDADEAEQAAALHATPVLHHEGSRAVCAEAARRAAAPLRVHVEVDTGMHRMGVPEGEAVAFLARVAETPELELEGVLTHFACADAPALDASLEQLARFRRVLAAAREQGIRPAVVHADNSAALLAGKPLSEALPEANAVRPGLMLYGVRPAPHLDREGRLRPVMTLRARVVQLHDVGAGEAVGYGATFRVPDAGPPVRVATLSLGYADGVFCSSGNRGQIWLGGALRPLVGRVSMDYVGVDVTGAAVEIGDEAIVFGAGPEGIRVEDAARDAGTIPYELLVRVGRRVARRHLD